LIIHIRIQHSFGSHQIIQLIDQLIFLFGFWRDVTWHLSVFAQACVRRKFETWIKVLGITNKEHNNMNDLFDQEIQETQLAVKTRISAALFDYFIIGGFTLLSIFLLGEKTDLNTYSLSGPLALIPVGVWFLYFVVFEFIFQGSPGKKILKLKVVSLTSDMLGFIQVLLRRLGDIFDIIWCFGILGLILVKNTKNNQRIGDLWAKTVVLRSEYKPS
jgi:uncharacterized RDD family membrane protein YckC